MNDVIAMTMGPLTMEHLSAALDRLYAMRTFEDLPAKVDLVVGSQEQADLISWMWKEYSLDQEWNRAHKEVWWHKLTPAQQDRETRRAAVYFKLGCQWHSKALPLPGTADFKVRYQCQHLDEYGDPL